MIDLDAFEDWLYENFKPKTITNTMRSLRYLQKNGVQIGDREEKRLLEELKKEEGEGKE